MGPYGVHANCVGIRLRANNSHLDVNPDDRAAGNAAELRPKQGGPGSEGVVGRR